MSLPLIYTSLENQKKAEEIASNLGTYATDNQALKNQPHLEVSAKGLSFFHPKARSSKKLRIDFNSGRIQWRIKRANHEKLIKKALGKRETSLNILDCSAGLLQDGLLFLTLGHNVTALEQSKILFYLLKDGISRSENQSIFEKFNLINTTAYKYIDKASAYDVIYFDPMYPINKKNALSSGQLEYIARILEVEMINNHPQKDFACLQSSFKKKIIVKRPIKSEPFSKNINYQVFGKTTRFDVYV